MWHLPGPRIEPVSPALAGRFPTTEPPGKPWELFSSKKATLDCINSAPTKSAPVHPSKDGLTHPKHILCCFIPASPPQGQVKKPYQNLGWLNLRPFIIPSQFPVRQELSFALVCSSNRHLLWPLKQLLFVTHEATGCKPWETQPHRMPPSELWGPPKDSAQKEGCT